jgi:hypothetical protein
MSARSKRKKRRRLEHRQLQQLQNPDRQCLEALKQKVERDSGGQNVLVIEPAGFEKMSAVLEDFYEPFADEAEGEDDLRWLIRMAVLAWNVSFLSEEKQREMAEQLYGLASSDGPSPEAETVRHLFAALIERKHTHFADNRRFIQDFRIDRVPGGLHLSVASSLDPPPSRSGFLA